MNFRKKLQHNFPKMRGGAGGQRPFGTFPKIHPFWKGNASLIVAFKNLRWVSRKKENRTWEVLLLGCPPFEPVGVGWELEMLLSMDFFMVRMVNIDDGDWNYYSPDRWCYSRGRLRPKPWKLQKDPTPPLKLNHCCDPWDMTIRVRRRHGLRQIHLENISKERS